MKAILSATILCLSALSVIGQRPAFGILVDNTGSMRIQFDNELALTREIVKQLKADTSISIFRFDSDRGASKNAVMRVELPCSVDQTVIDRTIDGLFVLGGQTTLLDAAQDAADFLNTKSDKCGDYSERNLVLITDGEDRASKVKFEDLISSLKKSNTKVYAIGLLGDLTKDGGFLGKSPSEKAKSFLEKIAKETGGRVVFPKKDQSVSEVVKNLLNPDPKSSK